MSFKSDRTLLDITEKLEKGLGGLEFKKMIEECGGNLGVFEKALDISGIFEGMSLEPFMAEGHAFSRYYAEIIIDTHQLYQFGINVFESEKNFRSWLNDSIPAMGDRCPIDLIGSFAGREWIGNILGRIEHGVYS